MDINEPEIKEIPAFVEAVCGKNIVKLFFCMTKKFHGRELQ